LLKKACRRSSATRFLNLKTEPSGGRPEKDPGRSFESFRSPKRPRNKGGEAVFGALSAAR